MGDATGQGVPLLIDRLEVVSLQVVVRGDHPGPVAGVWAGFLVALVEGHCGQEAPEMQMFIRPSTPDLRVVGSNFENLDKFD